MTPKRAAQLLKLIGWGFILFGIVFGTIAFPGLDGFAHKLTMLFDWTGGPHSEELTRDARWFGAIMSGLSAGFGAFYVFLVAPLLRMGNLQAAEIAKRGGLIAAFTWFIIDSIGSFGASVPSNIATNTLFLIMIITPLLLVKLRD